MRRETLNSVGIKTKHDINVAEIFSPELDTEKYGLDNESIERISVLKEFVEQYCNEKPVDNRTPIRSAKDAFTQIYDIFKSKSDEECWALILNNANKVSKRMKMSTGQASSTIIDAKQLAREALLNKSSRIIIFHNHPSGNPKPSEADIKMTEKVRKALNSIFIELLDHIIIGNTSYYSFAEEKTYTI